MTCVVVAVEVGSGRAFETTDSVRYIYNNANNETTFVYTAATTDSNPGTNDDAASNESTSTQSGYRSVDVFVPTQRPKPVYFPQALFLDAFSASSGPTLSP